MKKQGDDIRIYRNRIRGCVCAKCGEIILMGERKTWSRTNKDEKSKNYHMRCVPELTNIAEDRSGLSGTDSDENETFTEEKESMTSIVLDDHTANRAGAGQTTSQGLDWMAGFAGAIAPYVESLIKNKTDKEQVEDIVRDMLDGAILKTVNVVKIFDTKTYDTRDLGIQHKLFPKLLKACQSRTRKGKHHNIWITGPAGGGKTTSALYVSKALETEFFHFGAMDNEYKMLGFIDAQGRIVSTEFRRWWENGGLACFDEIDSWLPPATLSLNGALANGHCTFPDGMKPKHPKCQVIACANTYGLGGDDDYVGRYKQDKAFLDRFGVKIDWQYDEELEMAMVGHTEWVKRVQQLRARAKAKGYRVIISPRASETGAGLLDDGFEWDEVEEMTIRQGLKPEQWEAIR